MRRRFATLLIACGMAFGAPSALAADLSLAKTSPVAGLSFADQPLALPVTDNFSIALRTAAEDLGRTCGEMEAYGWRMGATEQGRVNTIFTAAAEQLRKSGYGVEMRKPHAVSEEITVFSAYRGGKELLTMWSAGELGLVLLVCDMSAPDSAGDAASAQDKTATPDANDKTTKPAAKKSAKGKKNHKTKATRTSVPAIGSASLSAAKP